MRRDLPFLGVLLCFFLSGFAALLYQTVWTRQFHFVFGTSDLAVATVLAGYMGGLALGAAVAGRLIHRIRRPIRVYGLLELGIAVAALAVPYAIGFSIFVSRYFFGGQPEPEEGSALIAVFYLLCSFVILLIPTAMMGATLPLLARHCVESDEQLGPRIASLYGTNTVGAVFGTLVAGFALLPRLGMFRTVLIGVALNAVVFGIAAWLSRSSPPAQVRTRSRSDLKLPFPLVLLLPLIFISGITSFIYEVLWTRLLGHVLGGSVYAFATMLASFLTGIALGSALASRFATTRERARWGFAIAQLGIAAASLGVFASADSIAILAIRLGVSGGSGLTAQALISGLALLPIALFVGTTYPFAVRALARDETTVGVVSARTYAWNTMGGIVGAVAAGFWLIPELGYVGAISLAIGINLALCAVSCLLVAPNAIRWMVAPVAVGFFLLIFVRLPQPWALMSMSPLDFASVAPGAKPPEPPRREDVLFEAVGRSASVLAFRSPLGVRLRSNGLPESAIATSLTPEFSQSWLATLPSLAYPEGRSLLVIGLGGGALLRHVPSMVTEIDVIELEPEVVEANRSVAHLRIHDPLSDPRTNVVLGDARGVLNLTDKKYDLVISQPSHPWTAGASHLYTVDFFELIREHMTPDGVFLQWIDLDFVDAELLRTLTASVGAAFPHIRVYHSNPPGTMYFLGSQQPFDMVASAARAIEAAPASMAYSGVWSPEDVEFTLAMGDREARIFSGDATVSTDDHNLLQVRSPRILDRPLNFRTALELMRDVDSLEPPDSRLDPGYLLERIYSQSPQRALRVAASTGRPVSLEFAHARHALSEGRMGDLRRSISNIVQHSPNAPEAERARSLFARLVRQSLIARVPEAAELEALLSPWGRTVLEGWRAEAAGQWERLRELDPQLAAVPHSDGMHPYAMRLRVVWRSELANPERIIQALLILRDGLRVSPNAADLLRWIDLSSRAGDSGTVLSGMYVLEEHLRRNGDPNDVAGKALVFVSEFEFDEASLAAARGLKESLRRIRQRSPVSPAR
ncbi:fused MFS/spermidine synthase [Myxococcota bacterium]|nr:fused MFS/spermidine synthase [Myxococcota bacterium]